MKAASHVRAIEAALLRLKAQQADEKEKLPLSASLPRSSSYDVFFASFSMLAFLNITNFRLFLCSFLRIFACILYLMKYLLISIIFLQNNFHKINLFIYLYAFGLIGSPNEANRPVAAPLQSTLEKMPEKGSSRGPAPPSQTATARSQTPSLPSNPLPPNPYALSNRPAWAQPQPSPSLRAGGGTSGGTSGFTGGTGGFGGGGAGGGRRGSQSESASAFAVGAPVAGSSRGATGAVAADEGTVRTPIFSPSPWRTLPTTDD